MHHGNDSIQVVRILLDIFHSGNPVVDFKNHRITFKNDRKIGLPQYNHRNTIVLSLRLNSILFISHSARAECKNNFHNILYNGVCAIISILWQTFSSIPFLLQHSLFNSILHIRRQTARSRHNRKFDGICSCQTDAQWEVKPKTLFISIVREKLTSTISYGVWHRMLQACKAHCFHAFRWFAIYVFHPDVCCCCNILTVPRSRRTIQQVPYTQKIYAHHAVIVQQLQTATKQNKKFLFARSFKM